LNSTKNGFFNFINRSNSSNKPSSSTQRKSKQYGNKRLSADVEALSKGDIDKVTINRQKELQSTIDNNINSNTGKYIKEGYYDDMFMRIYEGSLFLLYFIILSFRYTI
jgi:hypothetical protein